MAPNIPNLSSIINEYSTLSNLMNLVNKSFKINGDDLVLIGILGKKRRTGLQNDYDHSVEGSVVLAYLVGEMEGLGISETVTVFKDAIGPFQRYLTAYHGVHSDEMSQELTETFSVLRDSPQQSCINDAFEYTSNFFEAIIPIKPTDKLNVTLLEHVSKIYVAFSTLRSLYDMSVKII